MRSRPELLPLLTLCALLCAAPPALAVGGDAPTQQEVDKAVETVKKDPNLAAEKSVRTLTWKDWGSKDKEEKDNNCENGLPPHKNGNDDNGNHLGCTGYKIVKKEK